MEAEEFDRLTASMTEEGFQKRCIESVESHYLEWRKNWTGRTDKYVADIVEHEFFISHQEGYFLNLKPMTIYYVFGFCIDPYKKVPLGPVQKQAFSTPEYHPLTDGVDFDFMIRDTRDEFFYYVRPSYKGRICFDSFFSTMLKDSDYNSEPYNGDIRAYLKDWMKSMGENVNLFLSIDISRYESILELEEGEDYTIIGCPYANLGNGPLTLLHFQYKEGMTTSYGHDSIIN